MQSKFLLKRNFLSIVLLLFLACGKESKTHAFLQKIAGNKSEQGLSKKEVEKKAAQLNVYFENLKKKKGFNGVVLVAIGTQIIFEKAFGYRDYKTKDTLSVKAVFQLASVSKQFTAAAIMLLKQEGKLSFEDSIQKFFPDFPYKGITLRHLLTHHAGLSNYAYFCDKVWDRRKAIRNEEVLMLMGAQKPAPYFPPGRTFDYSNTGYIVLAAVVEKVSGMRFEEFMSERIFLPCHMNNTYVYNHCTPVTIPEAVEGYNYGRRKVGKTYLDGVVGDKGIYSNVRDLYQWNRILYSDSLFQPGVLEEAYHPAFPDKKNKGNYGFGWRIKEYHGNKVVWHSGWWEGYKSIFIRNLKDETVIIVLSNALAGHLRSEEILDVYYEN